MALCILAVTTNKTAYLFYIEKYTMNKKNWIHHSVCTEKKNVVVNHIIRYKDKTGY